MAHLYYNHKRHGSALLIGFSLIDCVNACNDQKRALFTIIISFFFFCFYFSFFSCRCTVLYWEVDQRWNTKNSHFQGATFYVFLSR